MTAPVVSPPASAITIFPLPAGESQGDGKPSLTEHFATIASAPNGIKKLRELILELAVQGKLVPQDPADEPAEELLKRAHAEKQRLVKEGVIRATKATSDQDELHEICGLPLGWAVTTLGRIALVNPRNSAADDSDASFVSMTLIGTNFDGRHDQEIRLWKDIKQGFTHFAEGDIAVAKITPCFENSKACVFSGLVNRIGAGTTELHVIRPVAETLDPRYVLAYLKSPRFLSVGESTMTGTAGQKRLPKDFVESNLFLLPPLVEQHRIVQKVDELMVLCDQLEAQQADAEVAHEKLVRELLATLKQSQSAADFQSNWQRLATHFDTLFTTEASIESLKQALLQLAVRGLLVFQAIGDEPADRLLERIEGERAALIKAGKAKKVAFDKVSLDEIAFDAPKGWRWVFFGQITLSRLGKMLDKAKNKGEMRLYLRNTNVQWMRFDLGDLKQIRIEEHERDEYLVERGDLLICEGGEPGRCAIWRGELSEVYCQKALHRVRPLGGVLPEYLQICLRIDALTGRLDRYFTGATIKHFPGDKLSRYALPLPPVPEQIRIVCKVDELFAVCDQLKSKVDQVLHLRDQLASALVENALS